MAIKRKTQYAYGMGDNLIALSPEPIVSPRAPTTSDRAEVGTLWIDTTLDDAYVLTKVVANVSTWINCGGGSGIFSSITINPGNATITAGNLAVTAGNFSVGGTVTFGAMGFGVLTSNAAGLISSTPLTNGQIIIGSTGAAPIAATLTAGAGIGIVNGANTITISAPGATAVSYVTDVAGPVLPDGTGAVNVVGGTNIGTDGTVANTITINLDPSVSLAGKLTAGVDLEMSSGTCTITSNTNAANAIYLHANAGVNETINIYSDQGTSATSINIHSDLGGVYLDSGLNSATAVNLVASNAAGGITLTAGTNGLTFAATNGAVAITSGTGAINIGADAVAHTLTLGSTTGAASSVLQAGTGALTLNGGGVCTIDCAGVLELNSSAGVISVGNDAVAQNINIGTGAAARVVTIGNATGASSVVINAGTGPVELGINGTAHLTTMGSTVGASSSVVQCGTGALTLNGGGILDIDSVGALSINSSAGVINIANDNVAQNVNIATGAAARVVTIGNGTGATSVVVDCGTGNLDLGVNAIAHTSRLGSTTGASATTVQCGTGAMTVNGGGDLTIDSAGVLELNSSGGVISIAHDAVNQNVNIATAGARTLTLGNTTGATSVIVDCGTGNADFAASATAHNTRVGSVTGASSTTIRGGTGGIAITAAGIVTMTPATDTQAAAAVTINANVGVGTFTGLTTAAAADQVLTVTNSVCTANSAILCTLANKGANDARCTIVRVIPGAGSFTVTYVNNGAAALNGDLILTFWIIA